MTRAALVLLGLACACALDAGATAAAQEPNARLGGLFSQAPRSRAPAGAEPELVDIERSLDAIARRADAAAAGDAIERGRAALRDAREALRAGQSAAATRKKQIAWAALSLSQQRIAAADAARSAARSQERERLARAEYARAEAALAEARAR